MTDDSQPDDIDDRIRAGDVPKFSVGGHEITANEIHALVLGLSGAVAGLAYADGHLVVAISMSATLVGYAILGRPLGKSLSHDDPEYDHSLSVGRQTLSHEPWYFLFSYMFTFAITLLTPYIV